MWKTRVSIYAFGTAACLAAVAGLVEAAPKPVAGGPHPVPHAVGGGAHPAFHAIGPVRALGPAHIGTPHITTRHIGPVGPVHLPATTLGTHAITTNSHPDVRAIHSSSRRNDSDTFNSASIRLGSPSSSSGRRLDRRRRRGFRLFG